MLGQKQLVPDAHELTPEEIIRMQAVDLSKLREELDLQKFSAGTIARFAICLIRMFEEHTGSNAVRVPAELYEKMDGAEIQIAQPDDAGGDVFGRYVEKYDGKAILPLGVIR